MLSRTNHGLAFVFEDACGYVRSIGSTSYLSPMSRLKSKPEIMATVSGRRAASLRAARRGTDSRSLLLFIMSVWTPTIAYTTPVVAKWHLW